MSMQACQLIPAQAHAMRPCGLVGWLVMGAVLSLVRLVANAQQGPKHYGEFIAFHPYYQAETTETGDRPRPFSQP